MRCQSAHCPGDSVCDARIAPQIPYPDRSPLYDVRNPAPYVLEERNVRSDVSRTISWLGLDLGSDLMARSGRLTSLHHGRLHSPCARCPVEEAWWSQTGSNRRPHACKARALPAELWPHFLDTVRPPSPFGPRQERFALSSRVAAPLVATGEAWWAWEDLNFRPHAYQARALTN